MPIQKLSKPRRDLTGKKFGELTVIAFDSYRENKDRRFDYWKVSCSCGKTKSVRGNSLVSGGVKSCGCKLKEHYAQLGNIAKVRNSLPLGEAALNTLLNNYRTRAKRKKISFSLSIKLFMDLVKQDCYYCGAKPSNFLKKKRMNGGITYNGIDRVDNSLGYVKDNCVPSCEICNKAKRDLTAEEFTEWINRLLSNSNWKKLIKAQN